MLGRHLRWVSGLIGEGGEVRCTDGDERFFFQPAGEFLPSVLVVEIP